MYFQTLFYCITISWLKLYLRLYCTNRKYAKWYKKKPKNPQIHIERSTLCRYKREKKRTMYDMSNLAIFLCFSYINLWGVFCSENLTQKICFSPIYLILSTHWQYMTSELTLFYNSVKNWHFCYLFFRMGNKERLFEQEQACCHLSTGEIHL